MKIFLKNQKKIPMSILKMISYVRMLYGFIGFIHKHLFQNIFEFLVVNLNEEKFLIKLKTPENLFFSFLFSFVSIKIPEKIGISVIQANPPIK